MINDNFFNTILNISRNLDSIKESGNIYIGRDFTTIKIDFRADSLFDYTNQYECNYKFFYKEKDNSIAKLALESIYTIKNSSGQNEIKEIIEENPEITIFGANRFNKKEEFSEPWAQIEECLFFIPKIELEQTSIENKLKINIPNSVFKNEPKLNEFFFDILNNISTTIKNSNHKNFVIRKSEVPNFDEWDKMIAKAHLAFGEKIDEYRGLKKVILSRTEQSEFNSTIDADIVAKNLLTSNFLNSYFVYFSLNDQVFISVTPEMLFEIKNDNVQIDSIAGTIRRSSDINEDEDLGQTLLKDPKEITEHEIVTKNILESLSNHNISAKILFEKQILKLPHVQHIHSKIEARINASMAINLINLLHPTAAIGGEPRQLALDFILKNENGPRGLYAAPIGFISHKHSKILVGIRSCLIDDKTMLLFGGCGVIKESVPSLEWEETKIKMNNFRGCLEKLNS